MHVDFLPMAFIFIATHVLALWVRTSIYHSTEVAYD